MKKAKNMNKKTIKRVKSEKNKDNKAIVIFVSFLLFCVVAIVGIFMLVRHLIIIYNYSYYTDKMEWYGYDLLYDNESAKSTESVLSNEVTKMVAGVLYNKTYKGFAKTRLYGEDVSITDTNECWIAFAKNIPLMSVNNIVIGEKSRKLQVAMLIVEGIEKVYKRDIEITEKLKEKYRINYTEEELEVIDKAISLGILENNKRDINKSGLVKGELNKMLIIVAEKYAMMYYNSKYLTESQVSIVTDKERMPENADKYPYIIDNISNNIYEIEMPEMLSEISETPKQVYDSYADVYEKTAENITNFFNLVLNLDYSTIDTAQFIQALNQYVSYDINSKVSDRYIYKESVEKYVDYLKQNEIKLSGTVTPLLPIIYSNGMLHYVRCKIEFKVINSKTNKNLLIWDNGTTYSGNNISIYTDIAVTPTFSSKAFRVYNGASLTSHIVLDENSQIILE